MDPRLQPVGTEESLSFLGEDRNSLWRCRTWPAVRSLGERPLGSRVHLRRRHLSAPEVPAVPLARDPPAAAAAAAAAARRAPVLGPRRGDRAPTESQG